MINLSPKNKQQGVAVLIITVILISVITLIVLFAASYVRLQSKTTSNTYRNTQAYEAAEAGLEYALPYLQNNYATIIASPSNGYISYTNGSLQNVTLANNSKYTIVYTNPTQNNYKLIKITVTGVSDDGTSTRVLSELAQQDSYVVSTPNSELIVKGTVSLGGSAKVINTVTNSTISSSSTVTISGAAQTQTGVLNLLSNAAQISADVSQNNSTLASLSSDQLFQSFFGVNKATFKSNATNYYTNSSTTNYNSTLNGKTNSIIWIEQTGGEAQINSNTVIGSAAQPVILVVNGNFRLAGSATIYGIVYVIGGTNTDTLGSTNVNGAFINEGSLSLIGSSHLTYDATALTAIQNNITYFAKVPGSWKDY